MMEVIFDTSTLKKEQERELLTGFDEQVWRGLVDFLIVYKNGKVEIQCLDGYIKAINKNDCMV